MKNGFLYAIVAMTALNTCLSMAWATSAHRERIYADKERLAIECGVAQRRENIWHLIPAGNNQKERELFDQVRAQLAELDCTYYPSHFQHEYPQAPQTNQPYYSELPDSVRVVNCAHELDPDLMKVCEQQREQMLKWNFVRGTRDCLSMGSDTSKLNDNDYLHQYLLDYGYECTAREFRRLSLTTEGSSDFQNRLHNNMRLNPRELRRAFPRGLRIAYLPPALYELSYLRSQAPYKWFFPAGGEQLTPVQFKNDFNAIGARVKIIHRVTTAAMNVQVAQTLESLKELEREAGSEGYVAVTRSAGSAVMTLILKNHRRELPNLRGVIHVGGVPRGSVIAEYKTRWDYFLAQIHANLNVVGMIDLVDMFDDIDPRLNDNIDDMVRESVINSSLETLSFKNRAFFQSMDERSIDVPVVNLNFLNRTEADRVVSDDPVYATMMMYGPTEGSGRLSDSAFETRKSVRAFYDTYGHLAFRNINRRDAINFYLALIKTSMDTGMITPAPQRPTNLMPLFATALRAVMFPWYPPMLGPIGSQYWQ